MAKGSCDKCGSSDAVEQYETNSYCFSCGHWEKLDGTEAAPMTQQTPPAPKAPRDTSGVIRALNERKITKATCQKYGVTSTVAPDGATASHVYPYYDASGDIVATKTRICATKNFASGGTSTGALLFGQPECRGSGKFITVTEGEVDCLSVAEMFQRKYDVVSVRTGAKGALKELKANLEFLESYDSIVLCFDQDAAGKEAIAECQDLFSPGKVKVMKTELKDANAMLCAGKSAAFIKAFWDAKEYTPVGIVRGTDTWEYIKEYQQTATIPYPWDGLNKMAKGIVTPSLVTITSGSGMGKTQIMKELQYYLLKNTEENIGIIPLEESVARASLAMMSIETSRLLHLEDDVSDDVLRPAWEATMGLGRIFLLDHFGSTSIDSIVSKVRYLAKADDCRFVFLDHLSIIVSAQEGGDERKAIDEIMTRLRKLCEEAKITLFLVSHLSRAQGSSHEEGGRVTLGQLRGSQSIAQLSDLVLAGERDQQAECPELRNTTALRVIKNRLTGETGVAAWLKYDKATGRMNECEKPVEGDNDEF